jgi:hypothetical protein
MASSSIDMLRTAKAVESGSKKAIVKMTMLLKVRVRVSILCRHT